MITFIKKTWEFLRPALLPFLILSICFLGARYLVSQFKSEHESFTERVKEIQNIHDEELKKIMDAQAAERERHEQNLKQLQQELTTAMVKHEEKLKELEKQKEAESKRLFEKYKDDPKGLAQEVSRVTGIPVYAPTVK